MQFFAAVASALSPITGGLLGGITAVFTDWSRRLKRKEEREHELEMAKLASDDDRWRMMQEANVRRDQAQASMHNASVGWRPDAQGLSPWAVNQRGVFRPYLTAFLVLASFVMAICFPPAAATVAGQMLLQCTQFAVVFWFGGRELRKI